MNTHKNLGYIKGGKKTKIKFQVLDVEEIAEMSSSCGCSVPKKDVKNQEVIVNFTPDKVPVHLQTQGWYITEKHIILTYEDGRKAILSFKAHITV